jgi:hypothetical protein
MTTKQLKQGYLFSKNGYTVYYGQGRYYFSAFNNSSIHSTLHEVQQKIKSL